MTHQVERAKQEVELERGEDEVVRLKNSELAEALAEADRQRQIAEEASDFKTKLLSIAAHDLRNLLHEIGGYADLLVIQLPSDSSMNLFAQRIRHSAQRMTRMLNNLLESSLIESGQLGLSIEKIDLRVLIGQVIESNQQRANRKEQTLLLTTEPGCIILADELRMWQVLDNLISNAIKFSPHRSSIWIDAKHHEQCIRCSVRDEGPGISEDELPRLFGKFERLSARPTDGEDSTGLGLSIVKQLVDLQGGRIWFERHSPHMGSTFIVEFPMIQPQ